MRLSSVNKNPALIDQIHWQKVVAEAAQKIQKKLLFSSPKVRAGILSSYDSKVIGQTASKITSS
jgi:hypothetical protein